MQLSDFGITRQSTTLSNGVPLIVFEGPSAMPVSLRVAFLSGSQFDPVGREGLAHFAEHMICSGTSEFPTKVAIGHFVEELGAYFNAGTSMNTMTVITDWGDPADTTQMVHFVGQLLTDSLFDPDSIEQERGAILAEMGQRLSDPSSYVHRLWRQIAYAGSALGRDTIGDEQTINAITRDDLITYYQQMFGSGRAAIVASGGITLHQMQELLEGGPFLVSTPKITPFDPLPAAPFSTQIKQYPSSPQVHLAMGMVGVEEDHPDVWPLSLLLRVLGRGRTSRLYQRLRLEKGLVYSVGAGMQTSPQAGRLFISTSCKKENTPEVLAEIRQVCASIVSDGVIQSEIDHTRNLWVKSQRLGMQTASSWADYHLGQALYHPERTDTIIEDTEHILSISLDEVNRVARSYLTPDNFYLAACGDIAEENLLSPT